MNKLTLGICAVVVSAATASEAANALELDFGLSERSLNMGTTIALSSTSEMSGSLLYHEDNGSMADFGVFATGSSGAFSTSFGIKTIAVDHRKLDHVGYGVAPGATLAANLTSVIRVQAEYYYSPSILSFNSTQNIEQLDTRFVIAPAPNAELFLGYNASYIKTGSSRAVKSKNTIHKGGYVGINFKI